jgi:hypothetical protein
MLSEAQIDFLLRTPTRVRVWDAQRHSVFVEGEVIAYSMQPMICVRDADGAQHWHVVSLPVEQRCVTWEAVGTFPVATEETGHEGNCEPDPSSELVRLRADYRKLWEMTLGHDAEPPVAGTPDDIEHLRRVAGGGDV